LGDKIKDGALSLDEFKALHRQAEMGDERQKYDPDELQQSFSDLDKDKSATISLDEWRRPFEEHTDAWLQMADTEAQQEAQIAHYKDVFNQMDFNGTAAIVKFNQAYDILSPAHCDISRRLGTGRERAAEGDGEPARPAKSACPDTAQTN
jgi:hypothetical protein